MTTQWRCQPRLYCATATATATLCATATATATLLLLYCYCRCHCATAKLVLRYCSCVTASATVLLPLPCRRGTMPSSGSLSAPGVAGSHLGRLRAPSSVTLAATPALRPSSWTRGRRSLAPAGPGCAQMGKVCGLGVCACVLVYTALGTHAIKNHTDQHHSILYSICHVIHHTIIYGIQYVICHM